MTFDREAFIDGITDGAFDAVEKSLHAIAERAKGKAPVRNIFADATSKKRTLPSYERVSAPRMLNVSKGPAYQRASRIGTQIEQVAPTGTRRGGSKGSYETTGGRVVGRVNSFAPVVMSPAGRIAGQSLREISARGVLKVQSIGHAGGKFSAFDLLSTRGRYELSKGRAEHKNKMTGETTIGGKLRDSIEPEGPYSAGTEIYGYVKAAAFNESGFNYAYAQEVGTGHNRPQPYLRPALRELHDRIVADQRNAFSAAMRKSSLRTPSDDGSKEVHLQLAFKFTGFAQIGRTR